ncbi:MAG: AsmA family protein [Gammaproteobacteria bacterium]
MRKPVKIVAILAGVVVGLIVLAIVLVAVFVDPNRYRDDIIGAVKTHTGRDFQIEGKLKLSFFPWLGLETGALQLANAPGFGKEPFARVESAGIKVELLPLLRKEVRVDAIRLNGLALNLAKNKDGRTNWDDLTKAQAKPAEPEKPKSPDAGAALAAFTVNELSVRNANVVWDDQQSGARYAVRGLDLTSGNLLGTTPVPLKLTFDLETGKPPVRNRVELNARANLDPAKQALNVPELTLNAGPLTLKGSVTGTQLQQAAKFSGRMEIARFNARDLLKQLGIAYAPTDAKALTNVGMSTKFNATTTSASLNEFALTLDDTHLTGSLSLASFTPLTPRFDLAVDRIDIDRYLPAATETKGDAKTDNNAPAAAPVVIPLALLREFDTQGKFKVQALKAFGIQSQDISLQVNARNGNIALGPNTAKLYGGTYNGRTTIDASGKVPRFQFTEKLANVQLGPFLKDAGLLSKLSVSGGGNVALDLIGQGLNADQIKNTLNGSLSASVQSGAIEGVDLLKLEQQIKDARKQPGASAANLLKALPQFTPKQGDKTTFSKLQTDAKVTNGIVDNNLFIEGPHLRVSGKGKINLPRGIYEQYRLGVNDIPLIVEGDLASPRIRPDVDAIFKKGLEEKVQEKRESLEQKFGDKLRKKFNQ